MRVIIYGNSGAGKTTMARALAREHGLRHLSLDDIAWQEHAVRRPLEDCAREIEAFCRAGDRWVMDGCYGDLVELALDRSTELRLLHPGVERCVENCRRRPWEPDKYDSPEAQDRMLDLLIDWVRGYETREDDCGWPRHREIFERFGGVKRLIDG